MPSHSRLTINGPTTVSATTECTWDAIVDHGLPPHSYEWRRDGSTVSNGDSYTGDTGSSDFLLEVLVIDDRNDQAFDEITVTVSDEEGGSGDCAA